MRATDTETDDCSGMIILAVTNNSDYAIGVYDADNSSWRFRVSGAGRIYQPTVSSISDQRLKENIVDAFHGMTGITPI